MIKRLSGPERWSRTTAQSEEMVQRNPNDKKIAELMVQTPAVCPSSN